MLDLNTIKWGFTLDRMRGGNRLNSTERDLMANEKFGAGVITEDRTTGMATGRTLSPSSVWKASPHTGLTLINGMAVAWLEIFSPGTADNSGIVVGKFGLGGVAMSLGNLTSLTEGNGSIES